MNNIQPNYLTERMDHADWLALQARAADLAGDHEKAAALRKEFDDLYDQLEASLAHICAQEAAK